MEFQFLDTAMHAAREAGSFLMEHFGKIRRSDILTKSQNDFLTFVDVQSEKSIISTIHSRFPDHAILAEESGSQQIDSPYVWIIDPLDGTKNYISGIAVFAVSIGLQVHGKMQTGVVYDPSRNEMFHAVAGNGAFLNQKPLHVSPVDSLAASFLATGFPFKYLQHLPQYMKSFEEIFRQSTGMRRMGAAALDLSYVAAGKYEAFWELGLNPWDAAAGSLLVSEAGGTITDFWGTEEYLKNSYTLASNGKIHEKLLDLIQHNFPVYQPVKG